MRNTIRVYLSKEMNQFLAQDKALSYTLIENIIHENIPMSISIRKLILIKSLIQNKEYSSMNKEYQILLILDYIKRYFISTNDNIELI